MPEKDTIAAQVRKDSPLHERFVEYEEEQKYESRSEAVRSLLRAGLDAHEEEQQGHREEARTATSAEQWCQEKSRSWIGIGILSAMGFVFLFGVFMIGYFGVSMVPDYPLSLAMAVFLLSFMMFSGGGLLAHVALRTGLVRRLSESGENTQEVKNA